MPHIRTRPLATTLTLLFSDSLALVGSVCLSICAKHLFNPEVSFESYLRLWPFLCVFLAVYKSIGLYSIVGLKPDRELRLSAAASAALFLVLAAVTVSIRGAQHLFTWTLIAALSLTVVLLPLFRSWTRKMFAAKAWWGFPAVIFGAGQTGSKVLDAMLEDRACCLKPVAVVDSNAELGSLKGIPVFRDFDHAKGMVDRSASYAVFATSDLPAAGRHKFVDYHSEFFSHVMMIVDVEGHAGETGISRNLGGTVGLELDSIRPNRSKQRSLSRAMPGFEQS